MRNIYFFCVIASLLFGNYEYMFPNDTLLKVAVFCSADDKASEQFKTIAYNLGKQLGLHNCGLITGGSRTGLMKEVVDGYVSTAQCFDNLYGVMPQILEHYNVHHHAIPQENLKWVETLHTRLALFHELSDIVVVLPGGFGTLHELMDFIVHNQFDLDKKQIILINPQNYWDHLLLQFKVMVEHNLVSSRHLAHIVIVTSEHECIEKLLSQEVCSQEYGLASYYWEHS